MTLIEAFSHARDHGVSPSMLFPLMVLIDDSPLTPTELAKRTGTSRAAITGLVDVLVAGGWVTRTKHTKDRRKHYVCPSEKAFGLFTPNLDAQIP
jgi:DNA-binding MarR family transcriptional regulator